VPAARLASLALPVLLARVLRLLRRRWAPLLFWCTLGYLLHDLALRASAWLAHRHQWLGFGGLAIGVLVTLSTTIMMFHAARSALVNVDTRGEPSVLVVTRTRRIVDAIGETILPFLVVYSAWGLFAEEVRTWGIHVINQDLTAADTLDVFRDMTGAPLIVALAAWVLRAGLERVRDHEGAGDRVLTDHAAGVRVVEVQTPVTPALNVGVAFFETLYMFFGLVSVSALVSQALSWLTSRVAYVAVRDAIASAVAWVDGWLPGVSLPWLTSAWAWLTEQIGADVADGLVLPLVWLVIAAGVFGEDMSREDTVVTGRRLRGVEARLRRLPHRVRQLSDLLTREARDKWTPLANGLRMVVAAGPLLFLTFCLVYVLVEAAMGWAFIGLTHLIGPHPWDWWWPRLAVLWFAEDAVHEVLRIAVLAATYDLCRERLRRREAERPRPSNAPTPPRGGVAPPSPPARGTAPFSAPAQPWRRPPLTPSSSRVPTASAGPPRPFSPVGGPDSGRGTPPPSRPRAAGTPGTWARHRPPAPGPGAPGPPPRERGTR